MTEVCLAQIFLRRTTPLRARPTLYWEVLAWKVLAWLCIAKKTRSRGV